MRRGTFYESIFLTIRLLKAWEDSSALVFSTLAASIRWALVYTIPCVAESTLRSFAQAVLGDGSRTNKRLRLNVRACKKAAN